jgi:hypothetical protein
MRDLLVTLALAIAVFGGTIAMLPALPETRAQAELRFDHDAGGAPVDEADASPSDECDESA